MRQKGGTAHRTCIRLFMAAQKGRRLGGVPTAWPLPPRQTRFSPVALAGVGGHTIFNPSKLNMNYSKKLKKKKKKTFLVVNVTLISSNI